MLGGRYVAWLRGSFGRPVEILLDGRRVGEASGIGTPGQLARVGEIVVPPGTHRALIRRGGGNFEPGNGVHGNIGPLVLVRAEPERLVAVAPAHAVRDLCGRAWDWIELAAAPRR
jgi:hypothetical protein